MFREIEEYEKYLLGFSIVEKPALPKFDETAYTDNEYLSAICDVFKAFENIDDEYLSILHLKGD